MQLFRTEIRPENGGKVEFAVGALVDKIVAQPVFSAGPDDQIGIRLAGGVQFGGEAFFRQLIGRNSTSEQGADGPKDFFSS